MTSSMTTHEPGRHVSYLMMAFPAGTPPFNGEMAAELTRLHDVGLIRVLDLLVILKDSDGRLRGCEATGLDGPDMQRLQSTLPRILAMDDIARLAAALAPDTTAGVVVWDNTWAATLVSAVSSVGGESVTATPPPGERGTWEPLSPRRHQPSVLLDAVGRREHFLCRRAQAGLSPGPEDADGDQRP